MVVGERIKYFREKKGITVNKLANLSGVSQSYLRDIELGKKQPTVEYLSFICEGLGITLETFFVDEDKKSEFDSIIDMLDESQKDALKEFIKAMIKN